MSVIGTGIFTPGVKIGFGVFIGVSGFTTGVPVPVSVIGTGIFTPGVNTGFGIGFGILMPSGLSTTTGFPVGSVIGFKSISPSGSSS